MDETKNSGVCRAIKTFLDSFEVVEIGGSGLPFSADRATKGFSFLSGGVKIILTDSFIECLLSYRAWWTEGSDDTKECILSIARQVETSEDVTELFFDYYRYDGDHGCSGFISVAVNGEYDKKHFFDAKELTAVESPF